MRWALAPAILALALAPGCGPSYGPGTGRDALDAPWLDGDATIGASHLQRLVDLGKGDPEATAVFREATRALGGSLEAVASHMSICPADVTTEGGLTIVEGRDLMTGRAVEELAFGTPSNAEAQLREALHAPVRAVRRIDEPDVVRFDVILMPRICFQKTLTLGQAYEAVVHELVHALAYDPHELVAAARTAPDETAFLRTIALAPGGEVRAYVTGTRARRRLPGGHDRSPISAVVDVSSPAPIAPEILADLVLAPPPRGLGYAGGILRGKYAEALATGREWASERRAFYAKVLDLRRQAIGVYQANVGVGEHNLEIFQHNVALYRSRGDAANVAASERAYATNAAELGRTRKLLEAARASEARLVAVLAEADAPVVARP